MTNDHLRLFDYLAHILEAIERIEEYVSDMDEMTFLGNKLVQDAVTRNIEIIGEASNNIQRVDPVFATQHGNIPWQGVEEGEMHDKSLLSCKQPATGWFERNVRERAGYWSRY